jgi:hypothetical protein
MTTDATALVRRQVDRWSDFYTRGLPESVAAARREELAADVLDQIEWGASRGTAARTTAREIRWRAIRGVPSDLAWRRSQLAAADSIDIASRVFGGSFLAAASLLGVGLFALALVAVVRDGTGILASDTPAMPTLVAALGIACGLVLLIRVRTRSLGALWIAASAPVILIVGLQLLAQHTTLLFFTTQSAPLWNVCQVAAAVCVGVFYLAAAVWWVPDRRKVISR